MKPITVTLVLGTTLALCSAAAASPKAHLRKGPHRPIAVSVVASDPFWIPDYNVVPRYRYNPRDDRVDTSPYAKPVAPGDSEPYTQ
jgi:hypothetical protein